MSKADLELADALHSAAIRLLRSVRHVDQSSGLSPARLSALSVLVFAGPLTVGRLAAAEGVKSPTMTGIVNGLAGEGLVERRAASRDQRAVERHQEHRDAGDREDEPVRRDQRSPPRQGRRVGCRFDHGAGVSTDRSS